MHYRLLPLIVSCAAAHAATCESLKTFSLPDTTIAVAESVAPGSFTPPGAAAVRVPSAFCRVSGAIRPSDDSDIQFEVWMPAAEWNGKFQGVGNGGFAGSIDYRSLALLAGRGYATAATDTGHRGGATDARWALHHPEKIADFGYRAIHETAVAAKAVIEAFYGHASSRNYFDSCSNGGRQALMEAQRYPADYDGIIAGAPANYWTHLLVAGVWDMRALADAGWIPPAKLSAIEAATLAACDALDGLIDGVIDDPSRCRFDAATLLCKGEESSACLTAPQVASLQKIYAGPKTSRGLAIFPGKAPGGATGGNAWQDWITGRAPGTSLGAAFATNFFANMVFDNPQWDYRAFNFDRDPAVTDRKMAAALNANDPDLTRFRRRGGKLILYHGWSDAAIAPRNTIDYYNRVMEKTPSAARFVRLFMVPGMLHCGGGPGPNDFAQEMSRSLERWVEQGTPPAQIVAAKSEAGKTRTRPLCPYPQMAHWNGSGSTDDASSFTCAAR